MGGGVLKLVGFPDLGVRILRGLLSIYIYIYILGSIVS